MRARIAKKIGFLALLAVAMPFVFGLPVAAQTPPPEPEPTIEEQLRELRQNLDEAKAANDELDPYGNRIITDGPTFLKELPPDEYYAGRVVSVDDAQTKDVGGVQVAFRKYGITITNGAEKGRTVTVDDNDLDTAVKGSRIRVGEKVALVKTFGVDGSASYHIADRYRVGALLWIVAAFFLAAMAFGGRRGFTSAFGLGATVLIIVGWAVPRIMAGGPAFPTMLAATFAAALISLYLAHGFNVRSTLALAGTLITLVLSVAIELVAVGKTWLMGLGSEDAFFLQGSGIANIDLRGLLLGGILLGVLGILDDVTTAQVAVIDELKAANPRSSFRELYLGGISVGKEHIASLTNTLFLAYAGASLPLFLLFAVNKGQPLWYIVNSEMIAEEIVRTLVGSICLILAVPISTVIAAKWYATRPSTASHSGHGHRH